jgi:hypothetical protein
MEGKTYLELLAEEDIQARSEYDENAKDLLVEHNTYEDNIPPEDHHPDEIENQEEFRKFGGSHQQASASSVGNPYTDKTKLSVGYEKDVRTQVISIDSRFRTNQNDISTNFFFKLLTPIKNAISIRLSSIEVPNTFYCFSALKGNITFDILANNQRYSLPPIEEGNYYTGTDMATVIQTQMRELSIPGTNFGVTFDEISGRMTIQNNFLGANAFGLDFGSGPFGTRVNDFGLGYNLGFRNKLYSGRGSYTAEAVLDLLGSNYLFLSLDPDWKVVTHNHPDRTTFGPFAKIVVNVPKNDIVYDNGSNTITKEYWFSQPTNITSFQVILTDAYEETIDLVGSNVSLTVEVKEVLNPSLYETMRVLGS